MADIRLAAAEPGARWSESFARTFQRQYTIGRDSAVPEGFGWRRAEVGGLVVEHCPSLAVTRLASGNGRLQALLIGVAVDADGFIVDDETVLPDGGFPQFERWYHGLSGRYVLIGAHGERRRLYLDAASDMAAVYDPRTGRVASSPLLALEHPMEDSPRLDWRARIRGDAGYAFGETPDAHVRRPITNHSLDLDTLEQRRHWPLAAARFEPPRENALGYVLDRIVGRLGVVMRTVAESHGCAMAFGGDLDGRLLAAAARAAGVSEGVPASRAAPKPVNSRSVRWAHADATGYQTFGPDPRVALREAVALKAPVTLQGRIVALTRCGGMEGDDDAFPEGAEALASWLMPADPGADPNGWVEACETWIGGVPTPARRRLHDMALLEQIMPNRVGAGRLLGRGGTFTVDPFNDRGLITLAMSFDPVIRRDGTLLAALVEHAQALTERQDAERVPEAVPA